jgi:transketolase
VFDLNEKLARGWSRMGPRPVYGQILYELAKTNPNIMALSADLGRSSGLDRFSKEFPDQFLNVGIAEQNLIGISSGLARMKFDVFASTFAPFASLRAGEQVRMNMGYMQEPVRLVGLASGFALGFLGNSHYGIEDVAVLRSIPGITIVSPADCFELYKCIVASFDYPGPIYIRLTGGVNMPVVYATDYEFDFLKADVLSEISDITVVAAGATLGFAKIATEELAGEGAQIGLVNVHTIKPIDKEFISKLEGKCTKIVVFEEHTIIGGLGSAIIDALDEAQITSIQVVRCGVNDEYPKAGDYNYVLSTLGLDTAGIKRKLNELL